MNANEQRYYDALKRITLYQSPDRMHRSSEKDWGLSFEETLEYAYENIQQDARRAIKGKRRPKDKPSRNADSALTSHESPERQNVPSGTEKGE